MAENIKKCLKDLLCMLSPELYSRYLFKRILGQKLALDKPTGMNEKLMWLKLNDYGKNPLVSLCADKYRVREYVESCGYEVILNELYGVWDKAEDIDWDKLPDAFVMKCNHGCGYNLIYPQKSRIDTAAAVRQLNAWLREKYWLSLGEIQYRNIEPKIICEKYLGDALVDYKIYCFNGKPEFIMVCVGREAGQPSHTQGIEEPMFYFFSTDWQLRRLTKDGQMAPEGFTVPKPEKLDYMLEIAEKLSGPFPFVRVDLYDIEGKTVFGELTFTPSAALDEDRLPETDKLFGSMIQI